MRDDNETTSSRIADSEIFLLVSTTILQLHCWWFGTNDEGKIITQVRYLLPLMTLLYKSSISFRFSTRYDVSNQAHSLILSVQNKQT